MKVLEQALPEAFAAQLPGLPIMPEAAQRALEIVRDPDACPDELGRVISMDTALTASVLRFANSAWFGFRKSVSNIPHAIVLLGFGRLRTLILSSVVKSMSTHVPERAKEHCFEIWTHSIRTAAASRRIALERGFAWEEEACVAGLLHDCGREVFLMLETDRYLGLYPASGPQKFPTLQQEQAEFGFTHADVGAALLRHWKLPQELVAAVLAHHDDSPEALTEPFPNVVRLATGLAHIPPVHPEPAPQLLASLKLRSEEELVAMCEEVVGQLPVDTANLLAAV